MSCREEGTSTLLNRPPPLDDPPQMINLWMREGNRYPFILDGSQSTTQVLLPLETELSPSLEQPCSCLPEAANNFPLPCPQDTHHASPGPLSAVPSTGTPHPKSHQTRKGTFRMQDLGIGGCCSQNG